MYICSKCISQCTCTYMLGTEYNTKNMIACNNKKKWTEIMRSASAFWSLSSLNMSFVYHMLRLCVLRRHTKYFTSKYLLYMLWMTTILYRQKSLCYSRFRQKRLFNLSDSLLLFFLQNYFNSSIWEIYKIYLMHKF